MNGKAHQPIHPKNLVGQGEDLIDDCVPQTQNSEKYNNQSFDVIAILTNMMDGGGDINSSTPTYNIEGLGRLTHAL